MYILIMSFFVSCSGEQTHDKSTVYEKEFYSVLNDLIRMKLINASVLLSETTPISEVMWKEVATSLDSNQSLKGILSIAVAHELRAENLLDTAEINYMYKSIDSTKTMKIDSARVLIPIISARQLEKIFNEKSRKDGYEVMKQTYGTSCNINVSTPLFNSNFTKVILWIDYRCGWKRGQGYIFILEKRKGLWWLVEDIGTWIS